MRLTYRERSGHAQRVLLASAGVDRSPAVLADVAAAYRELGDAEILSSARRNKVVHLVAELLVSTGERIEAHWEERLRSNEERVQGLFESTFLATKALESAGCRPVVIEGASTYLTAGLPLATYEAGDVDLLVDPTHFTLVPEVLESVGFVREKRAGSTTSRVELVRRDAAGRAHWIEVCRAALERSRAPLRYAARSRVWIDRRVLAKNGDVRVLHPNDAVVMAAMHASLHYFVRPPGLRLYLDLDRTARRADVDWGEVVAEIEVGGATRRCHTALVVARALLGTPVPDWVLERHRFGPFRWGALRAILEREGVIADSRKKLGFLKTAAVDALITDATPVEWLRDAVQTAGAELLARRGVRRKVGFSE